MQLTKIWKLHTQSTEVATLSTGAWCMTSLLKSPGLTQVAEEGVSFLHFLVG